MEDAEVVIFAYGSVARSARAVVRWARGEGLRVGMVRPVAPGPSRRVTWRGWPSRCVR